MKPTTAKFSRRTHLLSIIRRQYVTASVSRCTVCVTEYKFAFPESETFDDIICTAPPADSAIIPIVFRPNAMLLGAALLATLHTRSVHLFASADGPAPNPMFLPPQSEHSPCGARRMDVCEAAPWVRDRAARYFLACTLRHVRDGI